MKFKNQQNKQQDKKSIFRSLFVPLVFIMLLQAVIFYCAAVYGGIEKSLSQNASDILSERLINRKNDIETQFNNKWSNIDDCGVKIGELYSGYVTTYGDKPLTTDSQLQIQFLSDSSDVLINTLRRNQVNGIFLIINDKPVKESDEFIETQQRYGLCIRDMDQESNYTAREDLLLERAPSSIVDSLACSLDSWWEARYSFQTKDAGDFYYYPLDAAWENSGADSSDLAYCSGIHQISGSDQAMVMYSVPLMDENGYPYAVLGIELSTKYLSSLLPSKELNESDRGCYILALQNIETLECTPMVGTGTLYNRCFKNDSVIPCSDITSTGGFEITGDGNVEIYGNSANLDIYNNNNPFENNQLTLVAMVESNSLFAYISQIKITLLLVSLISLLLGIAGIVIVSRRFASPITALSQRVRGMKTQPDFKLDRLGITEIDQLVDSIEDLNQNVNKNSARTEFFSRMSHDMRTPMNAIISFSSPVLLENVSEEVKDDYLRKIHDSGEYLLELINEVLDMTKIESNQKQLHLETVRANKLFINILPIIEKLAQTKNVEFVSDITVDDETYLSADEQHLNQIVMNLLSNAVKFTKTEGTVKFTVKLTDDEAKDGYVNCKIVVADNGIGVSEEFMDKLYTPFEQENSSHEGTGLGLTITKKLVELMNGTIDCESCKNKGTTFTVNIPILIVNEEDAVTAADDTSVQELNFSSLNGKRILVCEDNAINMQIICNLLEKKGAVPVKAANGEIGVETFAASEIDYINAVLMDIRMPVMDGLEASKRIRSLERSDSKTVPIIAMTANAFDDDVQECKAAGMDAHLSKPVEIRKFYDTLIKLIS